MTMYKGQLEKRRSKKSEIIKTILVFALASILIIALAKAFCWGVERQYNADQASMCAFTEGQQGPGGEWYANNCAK